MFMLSRLYALCLLHFSPVKCLLFLNVLILKWLLSTCKYSGIIRNGRLFTRISYLFSNGSGVTSVPMSASQMSSSSLFADYSNCPQHRSLLLSLCAIVQAVTLSCPSALVWHNLGEGKSSSSLSGSPLDLLSCSPSCLPMPNGSDNNQVCLSVSQVIC